MGCKKAFDGKDAIGFYY